MTADQPRSKRRFLPLAVTVALASPLALLVAWPQAFGLQLAPGIAQVMSFRAPLALLLGVAAVLAAVVAVVRRRWAVAAGLAIVLAAASLVNGVVLLSRGGGGETPEGDLVVVAWNTQGGAAPASRIAELVLETSADVVSLPETDELAVAEVARLLAAEGRTMMPDTTYGPRGDSDIPTSVLISAGLGAYAVDVAAGSTPGLPSAVWRPIDGRGPAIVAAHPMPPLPGAMGQWRAGLTWVAAQCRTPDVVVAGDLNATLDHLAGADGLIGECRDAAAEAGAGAVGTWPATAPAWLAAPIDHVLVGSAWEVRGARVVTAFDDAGSDHRPIVAVLDAR